MNEDTVTVDEDENLGTDNGPVDDDNFSTDDIVEGVLNHLTDSEVNDFDTAMTWAVDSTIRYVVEWLANTGHAAKAEILESIGEV